MRFNPRTHTACDPISIVGCITIIVSIHARTRRATNRRALLMQPHFVSIHARTRRATLWNLLMNTNSEFQSTHAHGVRPAGDTLVIATELFQSTHAHGVRLAFGSAAVIGFMFQSTHAHGVRRSVFPSQLGSECFNPRTHTACDLARL